MGYGAECAALWYHSPSELPPLPRASTAPSPLTRCELGRRRDAKLAFISTLQCKSTRTKPLAPASKQKEPNPLQSKLLNLMVLVETWVDVLHLYGAVCVVWWCLRFLLELRRGLGGPSFPIWRSNSGWDETFCSPVSSRSSPQARRTTITSVPWPTRTRTLCSSALTSAARRPWTACSRR